MPARVNTVAGGPGGANAATARRRTQGQDQADEPGGGRANAPGGGADRVEISNEARNAQQGQPTATPREAQGRRAEQPAGAGDENRAEAARAQRESQPEQNAARAEAGDAQRSRQARANEEEQDNAVRARRQQNPGRNVGTRVDVAG